MVGLALVLRPFVLPSRPERVRELGDSEDPLPVLAPDLVLAHAPEQAEVVLPHGLRAAAMPELAGRAVAVEHQLRRGILRLESLDLLQDAPRSLPQPLAHL